MLRSCQVRRCLLGFYPVGYFYQLTPVFAKNPLTEISYQPSEWRTWSRSGLSTPARFPASSRGSLGRSSCRCWIRRSSSSRITSLWGNLSRSSGDDSSFTRLRWVISDFTTVQRHRNSTSMTNNDIWWRHSSSSWTTQLWPRSRCQCLSCTGRRWTKTASSTWSSPPRRRLAEPKNLEMIFSFFHLCHIWYTFAFIPTSLKLLSK